MIAFLRFGISIFGSSTRLRSEMTRGRAGSFIRRRSVEA
jgi:hypothetical protein